MSHKQKERGVTSGWKVTPKPSREVPTVMASSNNNKVLNKDFENYTNSTPIHNKEHQIQYWEVFETDEHDTYADETTIKGNYEQVKEYLGKVFSSNMGFPPKIVSEYCRRSINMSSCEDLRDDSNPIQKYMISANTIESIPKNYEEIMKSYGLRIIDLSNMKQ